MDNIINFPLSEEMQLKQETLQQSLTQFVRALKAIELDSKFIAERTFAGEKKDEVVCNYASSIYNTSKSMKEYTMLVLREYFGIVFEQEKPPAES